MSQNDRILETDDLIVLLLGAPSATPQLRDRLNGITRLEKLVFLLEEETDLEALMSEASDFEAHHFGPFSSKVYSAVETLVAAGLLDQQTVPAGSSEDTWESANLLGTNEGVSYAERRFKLTDRGRKYYQALLAEVPQDVPDRLGRFKDQFAAVPLRNLVRYVYQNHEKFTDKSLIRKQILGY